MQGYFWKSLINKKTMIYTIASSRMIVCIIAAFFTNLSFEVTHILESLTIGTTDMFLVRWAVSSAETFIRPRIISIAEAFVSAVNISTRVEVCNRTRNHALNIFILFQNETEMNGRH